MLAPSHCDDQAAKNVLFFSTASRKKFCFFPRREKSLDSVRVLSPNSSLSEHFSFQICTINHRVEEKVSKIFYHYLQLTQVSALSEKAVCCITPDLSFRGP